MTSDRTLGPDALPLGGHDSLNSSQKLINRTGEAGADDLTLEIANLKAAVLDGRHDGHAAKFGAAVARMLLGGQRWEGKP
ncbi:MAG: hypothetical protein GEV06_19690 [Luteitalea sp.]|nr:hypothetical protein [Luteitalea sp.]